MDALAIEGKMIEGEIRMRASIGRSAAIGVQVWMLRRMDALGRRLGRGRRSADHLAIGLHGEREALFHLRRLGYTIVARRWKSAKLLGDIDLIGWDDGQLCFVEVKTRMGRDASAPAEAAVDDGKRETLRRLARAYLRTFPEKLGREIPVRFDIVSVYLSQPSGAEFDVCKGAFSRE
jgi:putative endonuclease